ncbi:DUF7144 family membrane protein [Amycolatopsis pittospori]|uniref:DUF7144 family membrane protein n=1 Tax=Amycolatopsis pittospori TaxID=2749434 RepID=UPI0015F09461|nr:hypothetical protein [Amycolatopsis pittospori]
MSRQWTADPDVVERSGIRPVWAGWIVFASVMMLMLGAFDVIAGIVALARGDYYISGPEYSLVLDVTGWAWAHVIGGALVVIAGGFLLTGSIWARVVAVLFAAGNAVTHLVFLSAHPLWSMVVIGLCVTVIWAVLVHGDELANRGSW